MPRQSLYDILGVNADASADEIKRAYRKLAKKYHPDVNKSEDAETKLKEINSAYEILSDKDKRRKYDQFGTMDELGAGGEGHSPWDIFDMFDGFASAFGQNFRQDHVTKTMKGVLEISFMEAIRGTEKRYTYVNSFVCDECGGCGAFKGDSQYLNICSLCRGSGHVKIHVGFVEFNQHCKQCRGTGKTVTKKCSGCKGQGIKKKNKTATIKIPPGIENEKVLSITDDSGSEKIKIYIMVQVGSSPIFTRRGIDIYTKVYVNPFRAMFGGTVHVPTLDGVKEVKIPADTQSGVVMKIAGGGVRISAHRKGDLFFKIFFAESPALSLKQKEMLKKLADIELDQSKK
ncbi:chaperone protein DnaJ-like [Rattus rattus]|uniref:chaperone protein DnaJ-like n=1 Tax=Rattus rattus TaxID=10117 RepID=UPI0013F322B6|nr:chaperone protein DnaJ-like [Rattus rattus]